MKPKDWRRSPIGKYLRHLPRLKHMRGSWLHRRLGDRILHPSLWQIDRRRFASGFSIGSFFAMLPPLPVQMLLAGLSACLVRANIPAAMAATWLSNPFTTPFILFAQYHIGKFFIGGIKDPSKTENFWELLKHAPAQILLGSLITGVITALIAYPVVTIFWDGIMRVLVKRDHANGKKMP